MIKVKRNYGNGFEAEVEGKDMIEVLKKLAQADELFYDIRAFGKDESGNTVSSDRVKFAVRHAESHATGAPCEYLEQYCTEGPLKGFKREIGKFNAPRIGEVFVKKAPPPPERQQNLVLGFVGWTKYVGQPGTQYGSQTSQSTSYQQNNPQQNNRYQQSNQQQPAYQQNNQQQRYQQHNQQPQPQYNPHTAPAIDEDIPF